MTGSELELSGKVAIVTGAGRLRGIGRATANVLARMGADVVVTGHRARPRPRFLRDEKEAGWRDIESTAEEVRSYGVKAKTVVMDVTKADEVQAWSTIPRQNWAASISLSTTRPLPTVKTESPVIEVEEDVFKTVLEVKVDWHVSVLEGRGHTDDQARQRGPHRQYLLHRRETRHRSHGRLQRV